MNSAAVSSARERVLGEHARIASSLPGTAIPWLTRARRTSLDAFAAAGFPTPRDEPWKYTSVAPLERHSFAVSAGDADVASAAADVATHAFPDLAGPRLVFIDGHHARSLSSGDPLPAGVTLGSIADVLERSPASLEPYLTQVQGEGATVFGSLNTAFMRDGAYVHLARGVALAQPIHLLFIGTAASAAHPRNVIVAEPGARVTVIEHYVGRDDAANMTNAVTQVFVADGATIDHCKLQQEAPGALHVGALHAEQSRNSRFASHSLAFGARLARNDITTNFAGEHCSTTLNGLYLAGGRQHVDHHTRIDHARAHGTSREYYRGVLDGRARGVFTGKVVVHPHAQRTDAAQLNHNLLLSEAAEVDTRPQLEIYADDVKCTHGATVGQLDETQVFYLRSRGVEEATARALLTYAFAQDVIERVGVAALRARLAQLLLSRLPEGRRVRDLA